MASAIDQTCLMCARQGNKHCARCKDAVYCSLDCQRLDWKNHKLLCTSWADFGTPPTPQSRRGLLFPGGDELPRFIWLETEVETMGFYEFFDYKPLFGVGRDLVQNTSMRRNLIQGRDGKENLQISCLDNTRRAPPNHVLGAVREKWCHGNELERTDTCNAIPGHSIST